MNGTLPLEAIEQLRSARDGSGKFVVLTGAGISAESGIPTFRGEDGYWVVGSREYQPQEMATYRMFKKHPEEVWAWYLYRRGVCNDAMPNAGHHAITGLETEIGDRFRLVTQNVDGLHLRAGNSIGRTYQVHGNVNYARCADECGQNIWPLSNELPLMHPKDATLTPEERAYLRCPACRGWARPHVLWFDEYYDEEHFRFESSLLAGRSADVLLVAGTSGATNLPMQVGQCAAEAGALIVDINLEPNPFSHLAQSTGGYFVQSPCGSVLHSILRTLYTDEAGRIPADGENK